MAANRGCVIFLWWLVCVCVCGRSTPASDGGPPHVAYFVVLHIPFTGLPVHWFDTLYVMFSFDVVVLR
jgi:hypothetical protein